MRRALARAAVSLALAMGILVGTSACKRERAVGGELPAPRPAPKPRLSAAEEQAGAELVAEHCLGCHADEIVAQQRLPSIRWAQVIEKMHAFGVTLEPPQTKTLLAYLSERYSEDAPPPPPIFRSPDEVAAAFEALPDGPFGKGNLQRGRTFYRTACMPCHGGEAQGTAMGVALADRLALYRAEEFAQLVRSGRGKMPAYNYLSDQEIGSLLAYLRTIRP